MFRRGSGGGGPQPERNHECQLRRGNTDEVGPRMAQLGKAHGALSKDEPGQRASGGHRGSRRPRHPAPDLRPASLAQEGHERRGGDQSAGQHADAGEGHDPGQHPEGRRRLPPSCLGQRLEVPGNVGNDQPDDEDQRPAGRRALDRRRSGPPRLVASFAQATPDHADPQPPGRPPLVLGVLDQGQQFLAVPFPPRPGVPAEQARGLHAGSSPSRVTPARVIRRRSASAPASAAEPGGVI